MHTNIVCKLLGKNILVITCAVAGFIVLTSSLEGTDSTGAPPVSSGAPDEKDCTTSGCHDDGKINTGPGLISLSMKNNTSGFTPGNTYSFTARIEQDGINRFGYEVVAIDEDGNNAGEFIITDKERTQVFPGYGEFQSRQYLTYKYAGTEPYSPGVGQWEFDWKAPSADVGIIRFYMAALSGNNDGTDNGDQAYTTSLELANNAVGIEEEYLQYGIRVYPNPVGDRFKITFPGPILAGVEVSLYDHMGRKVFEQGFLSEFVEGNTFEIDLGHRQVDFGVYFLHVRNNGNGDVWVQRLIVAD